MVEEGPTTARLGSGKGNRGGLSGGKEKASRALVLVVAVFGSSGSAGGYSGDLGGSRKGVFHPFGDTAIDDVDFFIDQDVWIWGLGI
uniref:Uncharacterized protein n=1 Tax=Oryza sativa subsp. japonica TaxID=39947 RepID=Q6ZLQ4_ORYSJ|nr:hypothetical protein [Oryza sativa Japonica Group]